MRIAITYPHVNRVGGVERVVVESANELVRTGHEVHVFAATWADGVLDDRVVRHHVPVRPRPDLVSAIQFRRRCTAALRDASYDVHATFSALAPLGGVFWTPSVHRTAYETLMARRGPLGRLVMWANPYHRIRLRMERELFSPGGYKKIVALSDRIAEEVREHYDVPTDDIVVQPQGFDPGQFNAARRAELRESSRRRYGYGERDNVVVFVANELERKGWDTLVEAVSKLGADVKLLAVGRFDEGEAAATAARFGIRDRVTFAGSSQDVGVQLAAADAFALPTRYEPFGLVIVEALGAGVPVVTTRLAGASVAVDDGNGRLLDDPDNVHALAEELQWALAFDHDHEAISESVAWLRWENVVKRYAEILAESA